MVSDILLIQLNKSNPQLFSIFHKIPVSWKGKWYIKWIFILMLLILSDIIQVSIGFSDIVGYIISRMAFIQTFFELSGYKEVQLFRGMSTEGALFEKSKTLISASFNPEAGKAFSSIDRNEQITFSYLIKFTYPIKNLFMTFFETEAFNERYQGQEAVISYRQKFTF